jgi:hypothetical protein
MFGLLSHTLVFVLIYQNTLWTCADLISSFALLYHAITLLFIATTPSTTATANHDQNNHPQLEFPNYSSSTQYVSA